MLIIILEFTLLLLTILFMAFFNFLSRIIFTVDRGKLYRRLKGYSDPLASLYSEFKTLPVPQKFV